MYKSWCDDNILIFIQFNVWKEGLLEADHQVLAVLPEVHSSIHTERVSVVQSYPLDDHLAHVMGRCVMVDLVMMVAVLGMTVMEHESSVMAPWMREVVHVMKASHVGASTDSWKVVVHIQSYFAVVVQNCG